MGLRRCVEVRKNFVSKKNMGRVSCILWGEFLNSGKDKKGSNLYLSWEGKV